MSPIEIIYCSQYYELKKKGRDPMKGRLNGTILIAVVIMFILAGLLIVLSYFVPHNPVATFFKHATRYFGYSRSAGKLVGLICAAVMCLIIWVTIGSKKNYERMAAGWQQLPEDVLKKTIRQSLIIFIISFVAFLSTMLLWL